jgi:hypothetical protein
MARASWPLGDKPALAPLQPGPRLAIDIRLGAEDPGVSALPNHGNLYAPLQSDHPPPVVPMKFPWNF